ncbi:hypothetical protein UNDKW_3805 [Undibacterium sp. KW1]|uniref:DUF2946 family protein n=1 Tax=Undibacterium sp. KW1 TaxID=2058624 RepID=UPI001331C5BD|nr:DUF2946 family protein [Undibacterium sp. KW1]BBB62078.1 hypothetical protein UNDKW_3805 [Undibacterium sp. KW1]
MDEIVKAAMAKWPNVPHCYGWLALDARGNWRMRDERSQALNLQGDPIRNAALLAFITRNYLCNEEGCWYFQNGPQRVYVDLEATPYIANTTVDGSFVLQHGEQAFTPELAFLDPQGRLQLSSGNILAQLDDRDLALCLPWLTLGEQPVSDEALLQWLEDASTPGDLQLRPPGMAGLHVEVQRCEEGQLMREFGFVARPRANHH